MTANQVSNVPGRSSGALTTRLNTALEHVREALRPHATLIPGGTLGEVEAMLAEFARRRVRIALYGEVKAGKSTLLNAIAGTALSPVAFDPLTSVPVRVTYGETTVWRIGDRTAASADEVARLMRAEEPGIGEVVVETALDLLQLGGQVDLLDTPGVGSEDRFDSITGEVLRSLDAVVLVVRYPAVFTQATRRLMDGLQNDMGKLFVVWNLDQACAELTPAEKTHHTETLRANVAGAHDLFRVDARAGFEAMQRREAAAIAASGLGAFTAALTRFVSSGGRDLAAVREAGKRALRFLGASKRVLGERHHILEQALREARQRLRAADASSQAEADTERARLQEFETRIGHVAEAHRAATAKLADEARQRLRGARRRWINNANATALAESVAVAIHDHADAAEASARETAERLQNEVAAFGAHVTAASPPRTRLDAGELAPEERLQQAVSGNFQWARRALWNRWYLPGVDRLLGSGLADDAGAQTAWLDDAVHVARAAATQTFDARLAEIAARGQDAQEQIRRETDFVAAEAEFDRLSADLPVLSEETERIAQIAAEARSFF